MHAFGYVPAGGRGGDIHEYRRAVLHSLFACFLYWLADHTLRCSYFAMWDPGALLIGPLWTPAVLCRVPLRDSPGEAARNCCWCVAGLHDSGAGLQI